MKKLIIMCICFLAFGAGLYADNDKPVRVDQLPEKARQFINLHFPAGKVALAKMESGIFDKSYDLIFTNGNKIEFDRKGEWTEVDCKYSAVPENIIPVKIRQYITSHYPQSKIIKIDRNNKAYEVKLSEGWEVEFDSNFNVIDLDN